jgi:hypothetical protein
MTFFTPRSFEDAPDLVSAVAEVVLFAVDLDEVGLFFPRRAWVAAHRLELRGPLGVLLGIVVLAAVGLVDRIDALLLRRDPRTPGGDVGRQVFRFRRLLSAAAGGMIGVGRHAVAGGVDDRHTPAPRLLHHLIEPRTELLHAPHRVQAMVQVPHVAHDKRRLLRPPLFGAREPVITSAGRGWSPPGKRSCKASSSAATDCRTHQCGRGNRIGNVRSRSKNTRRSP